MIHQEQAAMFFQVAEPERQRRFRSFGRVLVIRTRSQQEATGKATVSELLLEDAPLLFLERCARLVAVVTRVEVRVVGRKLFLRSILNGV